ncbi:MAG TPA: hypothetical protein VFA11_12695 [Acidimicrobiales bacterium]|nr:hypothetical protein [Acidimicrobiales bacterium]
MHPIERLRMVARAEGAGPSLLAREAAAALASLGGDPAAVVTGCRRLVDRHMEMGPMWWMAARVLAAPDPVAEAYRAAAQLDEDPTADRLAVELPADAATVVVVGWPEQAAQALRKRGDLEVLAVDVDGEGAALARRLSGAGGDALEVDPAGIGAAVTVAGVVLLEALAAGPDGFLAATGSKAAAAVARAEGVAVWLALGVGRVLPARLWEAQLARIDGRGEEPWERPFEVVPLALVDEVVGPAGRGSPASVAGRADCPVAPELLRASG